MRALVPFPAVAGDSEEVQRLRRMAATGELLAQWIEQDARWIAWLSARLHHAPARRPPHLDGSGTCEADDFVLAQQLGAALFDVRRRALSADVPHGWPVWSVQQRATLCRVVERLARGEGPVVLDAADRLPLRRVLLAAQDLGCAEWASAAAPRAG